jgi:hypothetical protein
LYIPGPKPPFDIRDLFSGSELDNDHLQARYDTANRMILLTDDITFKELFAEEWKTLVPRIARRVSDASALGLLRPRPELSGLDVASCLQYLSTQYPAFTWENYLTIGYRQRDNNRDLSLDQLYQVHVALWQQGVYLPCPPSCSSPKRQKEVIKNLLFCAADKTYKEYYAHRLTGKKWGNEQLIAVKQAMKAGLFFDPCPNDRCCNSEDEVCDGPQYNCCCVDCTLGGEECIF